MGQRIERQRSAFRFSSAWRFVVLLVAGGWLLSGCVPRAEAQSAVRGGAPLLEAPPLGSTLDLAEGWLFHAGDDDSWKSPTFDDHAWRLLRVQASGAPPGHASEGWYRLHLRLQPSEARLALSVAHFDGSYRVFANGVLLGGKGAMTQGGDAQYDAPAIYPLPMPTQANLVVAIHGVWGRAASLEPDGEAGMIPATEVKIGSFSSLDQDRELAMLHGQVENGVVLAFWCAVMLLSGGLYLSLRNQPEYLALAAMAAALVLWNVIEVYETYHYLPLNSFPEYLARVLQGVELWAELIFLRHVTGLSRRWWISAAGVLMIARGLLRAVMAAGLLPFAFAAWLNLGAYSIFYAVELGMLFFAFSRRNRDAMVLLLPYCLFAFSDILSSYQTWLSWQHSRSSGPIVRQLQLFATRLTVHDVTNYAIIVAILTVLVTRTTRIARRQARSAKELEAAHTMQELLLSRASQLTPGFQVETVYYPESEVGGDFFFLSPGSDGSLVAIVGDVSGKGLLAAMRVSMILGVLRREDAREPPRILAHLNSILLAQGELGFTTACCVRLDQAGRFAVANAGHLAPYIEGRELVTAPSLPLGVAAEETYEVVCGHLLPGQRLLLLTDGVVEARSAKGELFGFARLEQHARMPSKELAEAARRFGQEDDITVLTIECSQGGTHEQLRTY